jgi:hypothetical protein
MVTRWFRLYVILIHPIQNLTSHNNYNVSDK